MPQTENATIYQVWSDTGKLIGSYSDENAAKTIQNALSLLMSAHITPMTCLYSHQKYYKNGRRIRVSRDGAIV